MFPCFQYLYHSISTNNSLINVLYSKGLKDVTSPVPVVGSVVEGVGNAPAIQKLGGEEEKQGYLGAAYNIAGGAVRTVYDAAGNVVCSLQGIDGGERLSGGIDRYRQQYS